MYVCVYRKRPQRSQQVVVRKGGSCHASEKARPPETTERQLSTNACVIAFRCARDSEDLLIYIYIYI